MIRQDDSFHLRDVVAHGRLIPTKHNFENEKEEEREEEWTKTAHLLLIFESEGRKMSEKNAKWSNIVNV